VNGSSLYAAVRCGIDDRRPREQLCRYIARPTLALERVHRNPASQVMLELKAPWHDGTMHLAMLPLEFMQRLAALVEPLRQLAPGLLARRPRERLLRGDQFRAVNVAEGSRC
jgi:hypothetical protein